MPKSVNLPDTGGRRIEPTAADIKSIEGWQADGVGLVHMARALKISVETLREPQGNPKAPTATNW